MCFLIPRVGDVTFVPTNIRDCLSVAYGVPWQILRSVTRMYSALCGRLLAIERRLL